MFVCLNCRDLFATENNTVSHKKVCKNKNYCGFVMPSEDIKILEFNQYRKYHKTLFIVYVDLESLMKKVDECKSNLRK